jgi:hypothetical protein
LEVLEIKDCLKLSDDAYHQFRKRLKLKRNLPPLHSVTNFRVLLDTMIAEGTSYHLFSRNNFIELNVVPTSVGHGATVDVLKV